MRIAFVITNLTVGGAEAMLLKLLQHMDRSQIEPVVISLIGRGEIGPRIAELGIPVHELGMSRGVPNPAMLLKLAGLLYRVKPDIVHTWMYHADLVGGLAARLARCPHLVWGLHHSNLSPSQNKRSTLWVVKACAFLSRWIPEQITSCAYRAKVVHAEAGYANHKIHVIPNGFEMDRFQPDDGARDSVRAELQLGRAAALVGMIGRYDPQKNHAGFIKAALRMHASRPDVHFIMAGTGVDPDNSALNASLALHPALRSRMHLLGRREDMPRLMASLDVLASPSNGEAFPMVVGEAMACGVPCVVTDVGDSAVIVGSTGRVVPAGSMDELANEVMDLLTLSPVERALLSQQARARIAAEYEIAHVARLYQMFYERLMVASEGSA